MAGTGNLILKRGPGLALDTQSVNGSNQVATLVKGMPAAQINGLSHVVDANGTLTGPLVYAYENYPNRLWIGINEFGNGSSSNIEAGTGIGIGQYGGSGPDFSGQNTSGAAARPIWAGAEIRADAAVYYDGSADGTTTSNPPTTSVVPIILQADWTNASDVVLVTQKAIKSYVSSVSSGAVTILDVFTSGKAGTLYPMMADGNGSGRNIYIDEINTPFSYATSTNTLTITGDLAVNGGDITTASTGTATIFNSNITTLGIGASASTANFGYSGTNESLTTISAGDPAESTTKTIKIGTGASPSGGSVSVEIGYDKAPTLSGITLYGNTAISSGALTVNGPTNADITTSKATANIFNSANTVNISNTGTNAKTVNIATAATGGASTLTFGGAVSGNTLEINSTSNGTVNLSSDVTTGTVNLYTGVTTGTVNIGGASGIVNVAGDLRVSGNDIQMNGGTTALSFSGSGDVAVNGDLTVTGNDIKASGGTTAITLSGADTSFAGNTTLVATKGTIYTADSGGGTITIKGPTGTTSNLAYTLTLPQNDGEANQVLSTNGSGTLAWVDTGTASNVSVAAATTGTYNLVFTNASSAGAAALSIENGQIQYNADTNAFSITGDATVGGNLVVNGTTTTINTNTLTVDDKNIELGSVVAITGVSSTSNITSGTDIVTVASTAGMLPGQSLTKTGGAGVFGTDARISTVVSATQFTTTVNHTGSGPITFNVGAADNNTANGGGITLLGGSNGDKTLLWNTTSIAGVGGVWRSSENFSILDGKVYAVGDAAVLSKTYLKVYNSGTASGSITIKSPATTSTGIGDNSYTLPTTLGSANQVLTVSSVSGGTDAILSWVDQSSITAGSVTVRRETSTNNVTKYPIPFLGSSAANDPASSWSDLTADGLTQTSYLLTDVTSGGSSSTPTSPTNSSTGLFYEVGDNNGGGSLVGTLYCDYIGATLDCGSY